jgi:hypothetical protein
MAQKLNSFKHRKVNSMSSKFSEYYAKIRAKEQELTGQFADGDCLISCRGCVSEVPIRLASQLLVEGSHTLPTEAEASAFREAQTAARVRSVPATTLDEVKRLFAATMRERGIHGAQ